MTGHTSPADGVVTVSEIFKKAKEVYVEFGVFFEVGGADICHAAGALVDNRTEITNNATVYHGDEFVFAIVCVAYSRVWTIVYVYVPKFEIWVRDIFRPLVSELIDVR